MSGRPAVFWDRDGVVNVSPGAGYVTRVEEFLPARGIERALRLCRDRGYALVLVTSQQGVGKGLMSQADLDSIHAHMQRELAPHGAAFDAIRACTHLAGTCDCRKPSPAMILDAAAELGIDVARSVMIGDHDRDILMGKNAGVALTIRLAGEKEIREPADETVRSISELTACLQRRL